MRKKHTWLWPFLCFMFMWIGTITVNSVFQALQVSEESPINEIIEFMVCITPFSACFWLIAYNLREKMKVASKIARILLFAFWSFLDITVYIPSLIMGVSELTKVMFGS